VRAPSSQLLNPPNSPQHQRVQAGAPPDLSATINTDKRVLELDGVRGLAIVMVLTWHYFYLPWEVVPRTAASYARQLFAWGWSGVDLFFVLSGFLIGGILMREREAPNFFRVFYLRRTCRILPIYYLVVLSYFPAAAWLGSAPEFAKLLAHPFPAWSYATFLQNWQMAQADTFGPNWLAVTWSLAIEEQFYLLAPLMVFLLPPRRLPWALGAMALLAPAVRTVLFFTHQPHWHLAYVLLPGRCDPLAIGMLGAYAMSKPAFVAWLRAHLRELSLGLLAGGAVLFV
jgi:peptidoglycan/LPS O-acetylase OafA/YrhL